MHELSVAHAVVSTVLSAVPEDSTRIRAVRIRVGDLSGVVPAALEFAYEVAVQGTRLADAVLLVERAPVVIRCPECGDQLLADVHSFVCPGCLRPCGQVVSGKEIEVLDVTLDDAEQLVGATDE